MTLALEKVILPSVLATDSRGSARQSHWPPSLFRLWRGQSGFVCIHMCATVNKFVLSSFASRIAGRLGAIAKRDVQTLGDPEVANKR